jgi:hypothetical protein
MELYSPGLQLIGEGLRRMGWMDTAIAVWRKKASDYAPFQCENSGLPHCTTDSLTMYLFTNCLGKLLTTYVKVNAYLFN